VRTRERVGVKRMDFLLIRCLAVGLKGLRSFVFNMWAVTIVKYIVT
jgi:hypothetical protein